MASNPDFWRNWITQWTRVAIAPIVAMAFVPSNEPSVGGDHHETDNIAPSLGHAGCTRVRLN